MEQIKLFCTKILRFCKINAHISQSVVDTKMKVENEFKLLP